MKSTMFLLLFFVCGISFASDPAKELDSLRTIVLAPKLAGYKQEVNKYNGLIANSTTKKQRKQYAKELIQTCWKMEDEIKQLYDYRSSSKITPVYVGNGATGTIYPIAGGFIYPTVYSHSGSLPKVYDEVEYIKDYAWRIRIFNGEKVKQKNTERIVKHSEKLSA